MLATPSQTLSPRQPQAPTTKITRGHSCVLCQQRKVKCDRQKPCSNCIKAHAECVASAPTLPRRRRRKPTETDLAAKLRKYEQLLKSHGVKIEDDEVLPSIIDDPQEEIETRGQLQVLSMQAPRSRNGEGGVLFTDNGNSHFVDNPLWENFRDDIQYPKDTLQGSSDDDESKDFSDNNLHPPPEHLLFSSPANSTKLTSLHPPPVHIFRLWQTFLVNVNPLVKIFHAPTVQQAILDASGDLERVSKPTEALMFSTYFLAVISLTNEECQTMFGEARSTLITKYSHSCQRALVNAKFLKSLNLSTLQALSIYLLGAQKLYDAHSLWVLTGVAIRIAQRLGLHRDSSEYKISPFDAEMRRRVWWQISFLDGQSSKLTGACFPSWHSKFTTKLPLNIGDSDLSPAMKDLPKEKEGITEMVFCCLRYDVAEAIRKAGTFHENGEVSWSMPRGLEAMVEKDKAISKLETHFEQKYLRHCDSSIPLHLLVMGVAKSVICTMRIMAHHPRQYPKGAAIPQSEKDFLFEMCLSELEIDGSGSTNNAFQGFRWHTRDHFQLDAFIFLLSELRHRIHGDIVERAWRQIKTTYDYRPELITNTKNALYVAIGNLTLKAWRKRKESGVLGQMSYHIETPRYITALRSTRGAPELVQPSAGVQSAESFIRSNRLPEYSTTSDSNPFQNSSNLWGNTTIDPDMSMPDISPIDWEYWNTLMDGDLPAYNGGDFGSDWLD